MHKENKKALMRKYESDIKDCNNSIRVLRDTNSRELTELVKYKERIKTNLQNLYK